METLVDELCTKLRDLEGGGSHDEKEESKNLDSESKTNLEVLTPRDRALRYYAAFPALQPTSLNKFSQRKDKTFGNNNNNNTDSSINYNNNKNNNKARNKKTKMPIVCALRIFIYFIDNFSIHIYAKNRKFFPSDY